MSIYTDLNISLYILDMRDEAGNLASNQAAGIDWPYRLPYKYIFTIFVSFLGTVNSLTPWSFAESKISRLLIASRVLCWDTVETEEESISREGDK